MKVTYVFENHQSTAYLVATLPDGSWVGTNKHTDLPVHLVWSDEDDAWVEVCHREWNCVDSYNDKWEEINPTPCVCRDLTV